MTQGNRRPATQEELERTRIADVGGVESTETVAWLNNALQRRGAAPPPAKPPPPGARLSA